MISECLSTVSKLVSGLSGDAKNQNVKKWCWYHDVEGHTIHDCYAFKNLSNADKFACLKYNRVCFKCVSVGHLARYCNLSCPACDVLVNGKRCGMDQHRMLHPVLSGMASHTDVTNNLASRNGYFLMVSSLECCQKEINVLWDSGSNVSLITHQKSRKLGLKGRDVQITITKIGNSLETVSSKEYVVPVIDQDGVKWEITACGIDEITAPIDEINMNVVSTLFQSLKDCPITRPHGGIHLLIGIDYCNLMPQVVETNRNLQLMQNQFGYVVRGSHPRLSFSGSRPSVSVRINHMKIGDFNDISPSPKQTIKEDLDSHFRIENIGVSCHPKCSGCKYGNCTPGQKNCSLKEERELALITKGLVFDPANSRWVVSYPWLKDPALLPNNVRLAISRLAATEKRLNKLGPDYCKAYQSQIEDMVARRVAIISYQRMRSMVMKDLYSTYRILKC